LFKFWTLCVFEPPFGGIGTRYDVQRVVGFLLGLVNFFRLLLRN